MNKIAFVGDKFTIEFFKTFGADIFPAENIKKAEKILREIWHNDYICIYITEEVFDEEIFEDYIKQKKLVVLPGLKSNENKGDKLMENLIKKATGIRGKQYG